MSLIDRSSFLGTDRIVYLDAAATSLMPRSVFDAQAMYYSMSCANPHSETHLGSRSTTKAIEESRANLARLFGADDRYAVLFCGNGSTACLNRASMVVRANARGRRRVVISGMEHHSNLLPWLDRSGFEVVLVESKHDGSHDYAGMESALAGAPSAALVASAASNVTGAVGDLRLLGSLARRYGAMSVVDAAQAAPHLPLSVVGQGMDDIDFLAVSGHKLFAPGSPGVLIVRRELLGSGLFGDVGGGTVDRVYADGRVVYSPVLEAREEAGTPNVPGTLGLGLVAKILLEQGMISIREHDLALTELLLRELRKRDWIEVYGGDSPGGLSRVGTVSFNLIDVPHGLVGTTLSDRYSIWVRTHCFCAHPYVQRFLERGRPVATASFEGGELARQGMVRASFGPWNDRSDIDRLMGALDEIQRVGVSGLGYTPHRDGTWEPVGSELPSCFSIDSLYRTTKR